MTFDSFGVFLSFARNPSGIKAFKRSAFHCSEFQKLQTETTKLPRIIQKQGPTQILKLLAEGEADAGWVVAGREGTQINFFRKVAEEFEPVFQK